MKAMACCVCREDEFFVAQCLNVDVSSFGATRQEAVANLKEAVELCFEGEPAGTCTPVTDAVVGQELVNARGKDRHNERPGLVGKGCRKRLASVARCATVAP